MTISGSYDFTLTRNQIITGALRLLGVVAQGVTPDSNQISDASEALNVLTKAWMAEGLPVWVIKKTSFSLTASTTSYRMGPSQTVNIQKPLKIYQAWLRDTTTSVDTPLYQITQQQYNTLSNKTSTGTPTQFYAEHLLDYVDFYVFPTADSTTVSGKTCHVVYQAPSSDFDSSGDTPDFPQEWLRALKWGLAAEIALEYGYPPKDRQEILAMAEKFKQDALAFTQEEGSLFFQIDRR